MIHFLPDRIAGKICADLVNHCNSNSLTTAIRHRRFCPERMEPAGGDPRCRVPVRPHNRTCPLELAHRQHDPPVRDARFRGSYRLDRDRPRGCKGTRHQG